MPTVMSWDLYNEHISFCRQQTLLNKSGLSFLLFLFFSRRASSLLPFSVPTFGAEEREEKMWPGHIETLQMHIYVVVDSSPPFSPYAATKINSKSSIPKMSRFETELRSFSRRARYSLGSGGNGRNGFSSIERFFCFILKHMSWYALLARNMRFFFVLSL